MLAHILRRLWHFNSLRASRRRGRSSKRPSTGYRPRVQLFEERLVPSTTWIGGSLLGDGTPSGGDPSAWSNPLNWTGGIPVPGETVIFTPHIIQEYISNGTPSFHQGPQDFTSNVDLPFGVGSVNTDSSWNGTINVDNTLSITSGLTLESGNFGGSGAMTLAGNSVWTQGDLVVGAGGLTNNGTLTLNNPVGATDRLRGDG